MVDRFLRWFSHTQLWIWLSVHVIAKLTFRVWGYPTFPVERYFDIVDAIARSESERPGGLYAFCSSDNASLSAMAVRLVTRGKWTHAGWLEPMGFSEALRGQHIRHMKSEGCLRWHLLALLREIDVLAVVRFDLAEPGDRAQALWRLDQVLRTGVPYDLQHELDTDTKLDCSEYVLFCLKGLPLVRRDGVRYFLRPDTAMARPVFTPEDVYRQAGAVVWECRA